MTWIRTDKHLPTREDAGDWEVVNVIYRVSYSPRMPVTIEPDCVKLEDHSHWAKLPPAPKDKPYRGHYPGTEPLS